MDDGDSLYSSQGPPTAPLSVCQGLLWKAVKVRLLPSVCSATPGFIHVLGTMGPSPSLSGAHEKNGDSTSTLLILFHKIVAFSF